MYPVTFEPDAPSPQVRSPTHYHWDTQGPGQASSSQLQDMACNTRKGTFGHLRKASFWISLRSPRRLLQDGLFAVRPFPICPFPFRPFLFCPFPICPLLTLSLSYFAPFPFRPFPILPLSFLVTIPFCPLFPFGPIPSSSLSCLAPSHFTPFCYFHKTSDLIRSVFLISIQWTNSTKLFCGICSQGISELKSSTSTKQASRHHGERNWVHSNKPGRGGGERKTCCWPEIQIPRPQTSGWKTYWKCITENCKARAHTDAANRKTPKTSYGLF